MNNRLKAAGSTSFEIWIRSGSASEQLHFVHIKENQKSTKQKQKKFLTQNWGVFSAQIQVKTKKGPH